MLKTSSLAKWGAAALLLSSLTSCEDILEQYFPKPNPTPPTIPTFPPLGQDIAFYALAGGTRLDAYNTSNAATRTSSVAITGLASGETLLAIDFRPATGQLYGVSSASRLYVINQNTGAARAIGTGPFTPALGGNLVGFDFNPTVDRIRLVTSTGQNLRLNPETGTVAVTDGSINGAAGATLTGVAYTNNTAGASTTALYAINTQNQQLYLVNPPNDGTVVPVGNLNLPVSGNGGFDIDATTGTALGLYAVNGNPTLFTLNLATGSARPLAQYSATLGYTGLAIPTRPVAYAAGYFRQPQRGAANELSIFDFTNMSDPNAAVRKSLGLASNETVVGLDFRPATNQLYALVTGEGGTFRDGTVYTESTRLYTVDLGTGRATRAADLSVVLPFGQSYGFDFNPVTDQIRIVTSTGRNLRVNPVDGSVTEDTPINPSRATIFSVAHSNNFAGATSTTLYAVGADGMARLYQINPPNTGTLVEVGGIFRTLFMDIGGTTNAGYAFTLQGDTYVVNTLGLTTGLSHTLGRFSFTPGIDGTAFAVGLGF